MVPQRTPLLALLPLGLHLGLDLLISKLLQCPGNKSICTESENCALHDLSTIHDPCPGEVLNDTD